MTKPALSLRHLTVNYDKISVLWDITCDIPKGKLVGIIGPNGAGKSTLIKASLALVPPLSGKVEFFGKEFSEMRQKVAYVPQRESVDWDFPITVRNLVLMGRYGKLGLFRRPKSADWAAADRYLDMVGMKEFGDRQISQLSGGQQQRVFIARSLFQEADIYFLDEPPAGIDRASEEVIMKILFELRDEGKTIFVVHHELGSAEKYFDWAILLNFRLIASGPFNEAFTPENLNKTYGKSFALFDEALKLSAEKAKGKV